ncbi:hypothetical protein BDV95DRAFT_84650 [Massariosphaeria phaeospora]|uniref:F-box domain-containing protein n=1 Tax=Massariosphaeria phaeospora TaxID=100035 RepID=A0A7C8M638_9PLEO|nr:hypothetical protein BDV95DRAFT_84650 [Massariosphaeria phaeospora]
MDEDTEVFPFLALPTELRLLLYFELLVTDGRLETIRRRPRKVTKQRQMYIAILQTCKLCSSEGLSVLYGENLFDFDEMRRRPSVAAPFLRIIGPTNCALIRLIVCEYSAASEEVSQIRPAPTNDETPSPKESSPTLSPKEFSPTNATTHKLMLTYQLTLTYLTTFLAMYNVSIDQLRLLAISIIPYGDNEATGHVMAAQAPHVVRDRPLRLQWLEEKNEKLKMEALVDGICKREKGLRKAEFLADVDSQIGFDYSPPFVGRLWMMYAKERAERK